MHQTLAVQGGAPCARDRGGDQRQPFSAGPQRRLNLCADIAAKGGVDFLVDQQIRLTPRRQRFRDRLRRRGRIKGAAFGIDHQYVSMARRFLSRREHHFGVRPLLRQLNAGVVGAGKVISNDDHFHSHSFLLHWLLPLRPPGLLSYQEAMINQNRNMIIFNHD